MPRLPNPSRGILQTPNRCTSIVNPHPDFRRGGAIEAGLYDRDRLEPLGERRSDNAQIVSHLEIEPVFRRLTEDAPEQQRQFRRHRPRALDDMRDAHRRYADRPRELGLSHADIIEDFDEKFTGMDRRHAILDHGSLPLVIIDDFDIERIAVTKPKT